MKVISKGSWGPFVNTAWHLENRKSKRRIHRVRLFPPFASTKSCFGPTCCFLASLEEGAKSILSTLCVAWGAMGAAFQLTVYHSLPVMRDAYNYETHSRCHIHIPQQFPISSGIFAARVTKQISWNFLDTFVWGSSVALDGKADHFRVFFSVNRDSSWHWW